MKRIISLLLCLTLLFSSCLILISCANEFDETTDGDNTIKLTENYKIVHDKFNPERNVVNDFIEDFSEKFGKMLDKIADTDDVIEYELQIGSVTKRDNYAAIDAEMDKYATEGLGVALIRVKDKIVSVAGSTKEALAVACDEFMKLISDDGTIPADTDKIIIFEMKKYLETGEIFGYTVDEASELSSAYSIDVGGKQLVDFAPDVMEYSLVTTSDVGYPRISVTPLGKGAKVTIDPPSDKNSGVATLTINSSSGTGKTQYKIKFKMVEGMEYTDVSVVNPAGKKAVVCYVIDDGALATGRNSKAFLDRYQNLKLTFALVPYNFTNLVVDEAKNEYVFTDTAKTKYQYVQTALAPGHTAANEIALWSELLSTYGNKRIELANHSYTHKWQGTDDSGGTFSRWDSTAGKSVIEGDALRGGAGFVKGSNSKEILAAQYILNDLFPTNRTKAFVIPGNIKDTYNTDPAKGITGFKIKYNEVLKAEIDAGNLVGARWIFSPAKGTMPTLEQMKKHVTTSKTIFERDVEGIWAFTTQNHQSAEAWKIYMDAAAEVGGLATFCLHHISDNATESELHISKANADILFKYAAEDKKDTFEVMNLTDAMMYFKELRSAKASAVIYGDIKMVVSTSHKENSKYNTPLTAKVKLPSSWVAAYLEDGTALTVHTDGSQKFIYVDAVPGTDGTTVYPKANTQK